MRNLLCCAAVLASAALPAVGGSIWIEGEDATTKDVSRHGWYDNVKKDGMSGGQWLSHYHRSKTGEASYEFDAPAAGEYTFWWRGNPSHAKVLWALNDGEPTEMSFADKRGEYMISDKPDHRSLAWVKVGKVSLRQGANTLTLRFDSKISHHGGVDCMVFDDTGFVPSGATRPGAPAGGSAERAVGPDKVIWIEGEDPASKDVSHHGWYDRVKKDGMSGEQWLSHYGGEPGEATYTFDVRVADTYTLWWRGNTSRSAVSWTLDDGAPREMSFADRRGEYMISDKPDHRSLAWVKVDTLKLDKGEHSLTFHFHSRISNHGGIDCLALSRIRWVPSGAARPVERVAAEAAPDAWFPVITDDDPFDPASVIDCSSLVPAPAGELGFLRATGKDLKFADAEAAVKFWGVTGNYRANQTRAQQTQRCRYLRKHGINMVRQHPVFGALGPLRDGTLDAERLDAFDWWFAELKKHGIYMTWSVFYPLMITEDADYPADLLAELPRRGGLYRTYGLVNVERGLQDLQLAYLRALLTHRNAYTGLRYVDDPALAVVEFQNEDTVFFHTPLNDLRDPKKFPKHSQRVRKRWGAWLKQRYGSEAALKQAWGRLRRGDDWAGGEFELMGAYHLQGEGPGYEFKGQTRRAGDFIRFLTELQRGFYARREKELRDLGFRGVTVTTAWKAGGAAADPANLYCDTAADMIDRHTYVGGGAGGHGIAEGKVNDESHMTRPGAGLLAIGMYQVEDMPFAVTEWTQKPPNRWKAEAAPLFAFYGMGLQGWDASYHFAQSRTRMGDGWPNLSAYVTDTPHFIGQFPALARAVYGGHVSEGPIAAARRLEVDDLFGGTDPLGQDLTGGEWDAKPLAAGARTPAHLLAVGRVTIGFDGGKSTLTDLARLWDRERKVVRSATGELTWDYARGVVTVAAAKVHAVVGRAGGHVFDLPAARVTVDTPFVSLLLTPLDDKPLDESAHVLITAMARDRQTGAQYSPDGARLIKLGAPPLLMEPVQATLRLAGPKPASVRPCDPYGVPRDQQVEVGEEGSFRIDGRYRAYYYELRR